MSVFGRRIVDMADCSICGALAGDRCRTEAGNPRAITNPHAARGAQVIDGLKSERAASIDAEQAREARWARALWPYNRDRAVLDRLMALADDELTAVRESEKRMVEAVLALHPKMEDPTHGCCSPPKLCKGHKPECRSRDHGLNYPEWPCATLRALGVEQ